MDDFATSATNDNDTITTFFEDTSLLNTIHLSMSKWATISIHLEDTLKTQGLSLESATLGSKYYVWHAL
jgi:hypothetical protein